MINNKTITVYLIQYRLNRNKTKENLLKIRINRITNKWYNNKSKQMLIKCFKLIHNNRVNNRMIILMMILTMMRIMDRIILFNIYKMIKKLYKVNKKKLIIRNSYLQNKK